MHPHLRAAADKLIFDVAAAKHVAAAMPRKALDRAAAGGGHTLRETFAEMAARQAGHADGLRRYVDGGLAVPGDLAGEPGYGRERKHLGARPSLKSVCASLEASRDALIGLFAELSDAQVLTLVGHVALGDALLEGAHHMEPAALDFAEALPEIRLDPLLLNWALDADFGEDEALNRRQLALFDLVKDDLEAMREADDEDEFEDEEG